MYGEQVRHVLFPCYRFIYVIKYLLINYNALGTVLWAKDITMSRDSALSWEINAPIGEIKRNGFSIKAKNQQIIRGVKTGT